MFVLDKPFVVAMPEHGRMDAAWERINAELDRRGRSWAWLSEQLGYPTGQTGNWKSRRVPPKDYATIAAILGESVDWVAGVAAPRASGDAPQSPMAARLAREFDQVRDPTAQLDAFAKCIGIIAKARDE